MDKQNRYLLFKNSVYPGWWDILDEYVPQALSIASDAEFYIKEKYGVLRFRVRSNTKNWEAFLKLEQEAERASSTVCELCGAPGKLRTDRAWIKTLCDRCDAITVDNVKKQVVKETEEMWFSKG